MRNQAGGGRVRPGVRSVLVLGLAALSVSACDRLPADLRERMEAVRGEAVEAARPASPASGALGAALCRLGYVAIDMEEVGQGHHAVEVRLNGEPARFIVDTGANATSLHAPLAERHGLPLTGLPAGAVGIGGALPARLVRLERMELGELTLRQGRILTADLSAIAGGLPGLGPLGAGGRRGGPIDGILGQDVLREHRAIVDVAGHRLFLLPGRQEVPPEDPEACGPETA